MQNILCDLYLFHCNMSRLYSMNEINQSIHVFFLCSDQHLYHFNLINTSLIQVINNLLITSTFMSRPFIVNIVQPMDLMLFDIYLLRFHKMPCISRRLDKFNLTVNMSLKFLLQWSVLILWQQFSHFSVYIFQLVIHKYIKINLFNLRNFLYCF